ncbi:hypothetical protein MB02_07010 [Croceicoccus estronivorus]|nr:hypothetical protein MB02_07010 [Croceicoccus estronivorus]
MVLQSVAPTGDVTPYDQEHLALYAALIDAAATGMHWREVTTRLMRLDPDEKGSEQCWHSHLERARWIIGDGLRQAIEAFGTSTD